MTISRMTARAIRSSIVLAMLSASGASVEAQEPVGRAAAALRFGADDVNTPAANAVVWINGCTGTLLTRTMAVSAGHCFTHGARITGWDAGLVCSDKEVPGRWYPVEQPISVLVGNDRTSPMFTTQATSYSIPGCADIFMVRLASAVPASVATPVKVLVSLGGGEGARDSGFFRDKDLDLAGWGRDESGANPAIRQVASARYVRHDDEKLHVRGTGRTITDSGDSGGPLFWQHPSGVRYLVGILQGPTPGQNENRYTPTYRRQIAGKPAVGEWFRELVPTAVYCDDANRPPAGTVPLVSWWSPSRADNFTTADARWAGCAGSVRSPDYTFVRTEGYIFNPSLPQPAGTVRLYSWYSGPRGDNYLTTHPRWSYWPGGGDAREPNYRFVRLEGFVFDPGASQPAGTVPLYGWYSGSREDNWTSAAFESDGRRNAGLRPDYGEPFLMGYVYPAGR